MAFLMGLGFCVAASAQEVTEGSRNSPKLDIDKSAVYIQAEYEGGQNELYSDVGKLFHTPEAPNGTYRIYLKFTVEKDGSISDVKAKRDPGHGMGDEAIRVIKNLPKKWKPAQNKLGENLRVQMALPLTIDVEEVDKTKE